MYVAGAEYYGGSHILAKYWKNGNVINLSSVPKETFAFSIYVSVH